MIDDLTVEAAVDRLVETAGVRSADRGDAERLDIELAGIDAAVSALLTGLDAAALPMVIDRRTGARPSPSPCWLVEELRVSLFAHPDRKRAIHNDRHHTEDEASAVPSFHSSV